MKKFISILFCLFMFPLFLNTSQVNAQGGRTAKEGMHCMSMCTKGLIELEDECEIKCKITDEIREQIRRNSSRKNRGGQSGPNCTVLSQKYLNQFGVPNTGTFKYSCKSPIDIDTFSITDNSQNPPNIRSPEAVDFNKETLQFQTRIAELEGLLSEATEKISFWESKSAEARDKEKLVVEWLRMVPLNTKYIFDQRE
jgi:hypothetical protein